MSAANDVKSIFLVAVEKGSSAERDAYLNEVCANDDEMRRRVEALLKAHDQPDSFLERPAVKADPNVFSPTVVLPPVAEAPGTVIGHYKLLQQIGEGGMGVVFLAQQEEPVRRKVALKIIKPGMDSQQVIARFEAERQALAMMEHQNIARVLDVGTTETGLPYFVMELVKGVPITEYCDNNKLTPSERLELFISVCQAIQHAHQKGIIHRDVKPTNVLVCLYDGKPVPKVIDFGVAKAIEHRLTEKTMFTQHGQIVGTLEYMSPEQAEMSQLDIDTRSDIYSLGVLLYELLTGSTPITKQQLREAGFTKMLRLIRETDPEKPSIRLSSSHETLPTVSAQRRSDPEKLGALLRGELDWVVMKALEKDRTRRYATASDFARDIQRHLNDEEVEACPPSTWYTLKKLARRNRAAIGMAATIFWVLLFATVFSAAQWLKAHTSERNARTNLKNMMEMAEEASRAGDRAVAAERDARNQLREAIRQKQRAEDAEATAQAERDRAVHAEQAATQQRDRAEDVTVDAIHTLGESAFHHARTLLASDQPGRRWAALDAIKMAHRLQGFAKEDLPGPGRGSESLEGMLDVMGMAAFMSEAERVAGAKPTTAQLRTEAVAALLQRDGRVAIREWRKDGLESHPVPMQWDGIAHSVSPDGRFAASVVIDLEHDTGAVTITDLANGNEVSRWEGDDAEKIAGIAIALGPQGKRMASVAMDMRSVNVWELPEQRLLRKLSPPKPVAKAANPATDRQALRAMVGVEMIHGLSFSPNGRFVAGVTIGSPARVVVWDLESENVGHVAGTLAQPVGDVSFSPDSRLLAFSTAGSKATMWNTEQQRVEKEVELPFEFSGSLSFTPSGQLAVRCVIPGATLPQQHANATSVLLVWDVNEDQEARRIDLGTDSAIGRIQFSPDGNRVAVAETGGRISVYNIDDHAAPVKLDHGAFVQLLAWSHDGQRVLSGGLGVLRMWEFAKDLPAGQLAVQFDSREGMTGPFSFSPDGRYLVAERLGSRELALFDSTSGRKIRALQCDEDPSFTPMRFVFSPDSRQLFRLATGGMIGWDVETGEQRIRHSANVLEGETFFSAGIGADGRVVIGGLREDNPAAWLASEDSSLWSADWHGALAVVSPDGRFATAFGSGFVTAKQPIRVYELSSGEVKTELDAFLDKALVPMGEFSPDNRWLLVLDLMGPVAPGLHAVMQSFGSAGMTHLGNSAIENPWNGGVWNTETGEKHLEIAGTSNPITYTFSSSGRYLAVAMRNGSVRVWDVESKMELFDWTPLSAAQPDGMGINNIAFTADSNRLVVSPVTSAEFPMLDIEQVRQQLADVGLRW